MHSITNFFFFFFQAEDGIRDWSVTGVQTCALPILPAALVRLRNGHERISEPCAQQWPERAAPAIADSGWQGKARGGGSANRRALGCRRSGVPDFVARCERSAADTRRSAKSSGACGSDPCRAELSQGLHIRKICACAAYAAADARVSPTLDSGQSASGLGRKA